MTVFFNVTLNNHSFDHKPTANEVTWYIRPHFHNQIRALTIFQLKDYIQKGYSFHATVLDYQYNTAKKKKDPTQPTIHLNHTCFVPHLTTLMSVDIDHGNFTLDQIKELLGDLPYALIYKTLSYSEEKRKYRVLLIADRPYQSEEEYRYVQMSLIYLFAKPFLHQIEKLDSKVDFSVRDVSRISFAGSPIEEEVYDRTFDLDAFIRKQKEQDTMAQIDHFLTVWQAEKKRRDELLANELNLPQKAKTRSKGQNKKTNLTNPQPLAKEDVFYTLIQRLKDYAVEMSLSERKIDFLDTIGFINEIPLTYLLEEEVYHSFCCKLPHHHDSHPSANIMLDEDGLTRYYCAACHDLHALSTFDFIEEVIHDKLKYNRYQVIKLVFELLELPLHSQYQTEAIMSLLENDRFFSEWDEDDTLYRHLNRKGILMLWLELNQLAKLRTPLRPLTKDKNNKNPCFFASTRNIHETMARKRRMEQKKGGSSYRGFKDHIVTNRKINELVKYGLIHKIEESDLDPDFLIQSQEIRQAIRKQEERQEKALLKPKKEKKERRIDYYEIPIVNPTLLQEALDMILFEKKAGIKAKGRSMKQALTVYGEKKASSIYTQSDIKLGRQDQTFLKHLNTAIDVLLEKQGYFTEKQLISKIDPKGNLFKTKEVKVEGVVVRTITPKSQKEHKMNQFLGGVCLERGLERATVNKTTRQQFSLPKSLTSNSVIYIPTQPSL